LASSPLGVDVRGSGYVGRVARTADVAFFIALCAIGIYWLVDNTVVDVLALILAAGCVVVEVALTAGVVLRKLSRSRDRQ
jgi:hypothetical protein